jgi:hypothetical protein
MCSYIQPPIQSGDRSILEMFEARRIILLLIAELERNLKPICCARASPLLGFTGGCTSHLYVESTTVVMNGTVAMFVLSQPRSTPRDGDVTHDGI